MVTLLPAPSPIPESLNGLGRTLILTLVLELPDGELGIGELDCWGTFKWFECWDDLEECRWS
jgi:hypothetical protein